MSPYNRYDGSFNPRNGLRLSTDSRKPIFRSAEVAFGVGVAAPPVNGAEAPTDRTDTTTTTRPQIRATTPDFVETPPAGANLKKTLGPLQRRDALEPLNRLPDSFGGIRWNFRGLPFSVHRFENRNHGFTKS